MLACTAVPNPPEPPPDALARLTDSLARYSSELLGAGAPAVVSAVKVRDAGWSQADGVRSLEDRLALAGTSPKDCLRQVLTRGTARATIALVR